MLKYDDLLAKISLKEILNDKELKELKKYNQFKNASEKGYIYERDKLILNLVSLAIDKFFLMKENILVKCFQWVKKIFQENILVFKNDLTIYLQYQE